MNWVNGCFQHLFDNYNKINTNVKEKMLQILSSIDNLYQEIEVRIDKVVGIVLNFNCHIKVTNVFRENGLLLHEIHIRGPKAFLMLLFGNDTLCQIILSLEQFFFQIMA